MLVSEKRLAANRKNAQKSTGPKTPEGKERSRVNALKHGLCATVLQAEDANLLQQHAEALFRALKPTDDYHAYHIDRAAVISVRIARCERMERRVRDKISLRAELFWDDDRRHEAEILGAKLSRNPALTVEGLRRTPHGCEWLMTRWAMLAHAAETNDGKEWTEEQVGLAFDLLATPKEFRSGKTPGTAIDLEGNVTAPFEDLAGMSRRMVAELKERQDEVSGMDEVERTLAVVDLGDDSDPELKRLRRYESMLYSRFRWTLKQINHIWDGLKVDPAFLPRYTASEVSEPEPKHPDEILAENHPADSPHPPFCLTPDEFPPPGQKANIPVILTSRRQKRIAKAEARREARRRKVEKLRS